MNFHGIGGQIASVASQPAGLGCSGDCTVSSAYPLGTRVTLTVTQAPDAMVAWSNGCQGASCMFEVDGPTTVNATSTDENIVFITSQPHAGNFGGLSAANDFCNATAARAGLPGTFAAFLGTSAASAYQALGIVARGWIRPDGLPFTDTSGAFETNGTMWYPAALDETGKPASGAHFGTSRSANCSDWSSASGQGTLGWAGESNYFLGFETADCAGALVPCFGTTFSQVVTVEPVSGRLVFITTEAFTPSGGVAAADQLCQSEAQAASLPNPTHFLAALATTTASVASRFNLNGPTWVRVDGVPVASSPANFMAGILIAPPSLDPNAKLQSTLLSPFGAWLGSVGGLTAPAGSVSESCADWTSTTGSAVTFQPAWGGPDAPGNAFLQFATSAEGCALTHFAVMCLEN